METESDRIKSVYHARHQQGIDARYNILRAENWLGIQALERAMIKCFRRAAITDLSILKFLDVGCGTGGSLLRWIEWGASPSMCNGVDLVDTHIEQAKVRLPASVNLQLSDASRLPFADNAFDVTSHFTVLSSILDENMQAMVAGEMLRVTGPNGIILSYDFWLNPQNPATRGLRIARIRRLFPNCNMYIQRITLAPPICRRVASFSPLCCRILEAAKLFNSHFLVMIQRRTLS